MTQIELKKVATHNLKNIDISLPLQKVVVVTGRSGSGKSSLVFDTLYGEAYSRYMEGLSSEVRHVLKHLQRPTLAEVKNLPPALALRQFQLGSRHPRSTVGSVAECLDLMRALFQIAGVIHCPDHGPIRVYDPSSLATHLLTHKAGERVWVGSPLSGWDQLAPKALWAQLLRQGFTRLYYQGETVRLEDQAPKNLKDYLVIVDRLSLSLEEQPRLVQALTLAFQLGRGQVRIAFGASSEQEVYFKGPTCSQCLKTFPHLSAVYFNPHHPLGACEHCQGFGKVAEIDPDKVIKDQSLSLLTEGVLPWNFGRSKSYYEKAQRAFLKEGLDPKTPFSHYQKSHWQLLWEGKRGSGYGGLNGFFRWLEKKAYKPHYRIHLARFRRYVPCKSCLGAMLGPLGRHCYFDGMTYPEAMEKPIELLTKQLALLENPALQEPLRELLPKLQYLEQVGLSYLQLGRQANTLSGGEMQRIVMARSLGNPLTGSLYCLDEPSAGLHAYDVKRLEQVIHGLKNQGNTVVMVEHHPELILSSDHMVTLGPLAGEQGGELIYEGPPRVESLAWRGSPLAPKDFLRFPGSFHHNLKGEAFEIAFNRINVICGISGSGKSTLLLDHMKPCFEDKASKLVPKGLREQLLECHLVRQDGFGRSSRSNIATYLNLFTPIRQLLASQPMAQGLGLKPRDFSFNVPGGRCEACKGLGVVDEDLSFLGEVAVTCRECHGHRFAEAVLSVRFREKNISEIMDMTISSAAEHFFDQPSILTGLDQVIQLGLGYVRLGQPTASFSGGEGQRLKLLRILKEITVKSLVLVDEPSIGLSEADVEMFYLKLKKLIDRGHTIVLVEHHLSLIKNADWVIELGPGAGDGGGQITFMGTPAQLKTCPSSKTAPFL